MTTHTVIIVPVLGRPAAADPLVRSVVGATGGGVRILFVPDVNDHEQIKACSETGADMLIMDGNYARKINDGILHTNEPYIFNAADDLVFHPGWLDEAMRVMDTDGIQVVGTNDLGNGRVMAGLHATHNLVTRDYVNLYGTADEPGKMFHEGYRHNFCDDELVQTAQRRNMWAFAERSHVEHMHPFWGKGEDDETYKKGIKHFRRDRQYFRYRKETLWDT